MYVSLLYLLLVVIQKRCITHLVSHVTTTTAVIIVICKGRECESRNPLSLSLLDFLVLPHKHQHTPEQVYTLLLVTRVDDFVVRFLVSFVCQLTSATLCPMALSLSFHYTFVSISHSLFFSIHYIPRFITI